MLRFMKTFKPRRVMVFFATCASVDFYHHVLSNILSNVNFEKLHRKIDSKKRSKIIEQFSKSKGPAVLLTTDIAARGIDVPDINWIIQVDPPQDTSEQYVHRIGRTARAGKLGKVSQFLI
jgi:ATP-dependent RNA helicase DDX55/SPB4